MEAMVNLVASMAAVVLAAWMAETSVGRAEAVATWAERAGAQVDLEMVPLEAREAIHPVGRDPCQALGEGQSHPQP